MHVKCIISDGGFLVLKSALSIFLFPGNLALRVVGISIEEDGGIFRSMVNMLFWGALLTPLILFVVLKFA